MPKTHFITGLDIGSKSIKILIAGREERPASGYPEKLEVIFQSEEPSVGVRRGVVVDGEGVSNILQNLVSRAKEEANLKIDSAYFNVDGAHLFSLPSQGTIAVSRADQKISEEDVQRVLSAAQTFSLPSNKEIFDVFPREFIVDGEKGIKEPLGLQGVRLEAEVLVLGGFSPYLKNLTQAVLDSRLQILDRIPSPIAAARACLSGKQKELGVAILDIGAGTSGLAVFEEEDLIHLAVLPIGSSNITNDIAIGLKTDIDIAERIKIEFGSCILKNGQKREKIKLGEEEILVFSRKQLTNIIEARVSEIFREANKELKKIGKEKLLPAGIVLTGGGSKLPKIVELAKKEFHLPSKLGNPKGVKEDKSSSPTLAGARVIEGLEEDSSLATVSGLVLLGSDWEGEAKSPTFSGEGLASKLKRIFKIFIP